MCLTTLSIVSNSFSSALQRSGDTCAWDMETWTCPHHWSAWERGLGSSWSFVGRKNLWEIEREHGCVLFISSPKAAEGFNLGHCPWAGELLGQITGKMEQLLFHVFNTTSQVHVLPWPTTQETSISYPQWPVGSSSVPVKNHITQTDLCSRDTLTKNLAVLDFVWAESYYLHTLASRLWLTCLLRSCVLLLLRK